MTLLTRAKKKKKIQILYDNIYIYMMLTKESQGSLLELQLVNLIVLLINNKTSQMVLSLGT